MEEIFRAGIKEKKKLVLTKNGLGKKLLHFKRKNLIFLKKIRKNF